MIPLAERRLLVVSRPKLSIRKQCRILGIYRSGLYYENRGESAENLELMRWMDEHYYDHPYKGAPRMYTWLTKDKGFKSEPQSSGSTVLQSDGSASNCTRATYF